jgi:hypothetical protein
MRPLLGFGAWRQTHFSMCHKGSKMRSFGANAPNLAALFLGLTEKYCFFFIVGKWRGLTLDNDVYYLRD